MKDHLPLALPDDWEEYRPREVNLNTLTIRLGHKNHHPALLALTPDDPNFSEDLLHQQTARHDYRADLKITEYPNEQSAKQALSDYRLEEVKSQQNINQPPHSLGWKESLRNMGYLTMEDEFLGENAIFFINPKKEKLGNKLGRDYDIIYEKGKEPHIHIEYDPKEQVK